MPCSSCCNSLKGAKIKSKSMYNGHALYIQSRLSYWATNPIQVGRLGNQLSSYVNLLTLGLSFTISPAIPKKVKDTVVSFFR